MTVSEYSQPTFDVRSPQLLARLAGTLYLAIIVLGLFAELGVRGRLVVPGDAEATAANILGAEALFRLGFAAEATMALCDVALAVLLFGLLGPVSPTVSLLAMVFRLMQAAVVSATLLDHHAALLLLQAPGNAELALHALERRAHGYDLGLIFFGVNSLATGWLVWRSGFLPSLLGLGIALAGVVYLAGSLLLFLLPAWAGPFAPAYAIPLLAETAFCLWLLVRGVDVAAWRCWTLPRS